MSTQLNDTHYAIIAAVHEQMPSHLFMSMSGDYNTHTLMWYTERAGGKEEHSLRFDSYAAQRAFISALESEGYFAQSSVSGLMFKRDSMRIPASVYKPKQDEQDDREMQIHANLAIAYEPRRRKGTMSNHFSFHKFWDFVDSVSDDETESGWVEGFSFGKELNEASGEIARIEGLIREILGASSSEIGFNFNQDDEDEDEDFLPSTLKRLRNSK